MGPSLTLLSSSELTNQNVMDTMYKVQPREGADGSTKVSDIASVVLLRTATDLDSHHCLLTQ